MNTRFVRIALVAAGLPMLAFLTQTACQSNQQQQAAQGLNCLEGQIKQSVGGVCSCVPNTNGAVANCN